MENRLKSSDFRLTNSFYPAKSGLITTVAQPNEEEDIRKFIFLNSDQGSNTCQATKR